MLCSNQIVITPGEAMHRTIFQNLYKRWTKHDAADDTALEAINTRIILKSDEMIYKIKLSL